MLNGRRRCLRHWIKREAWSCQAVSTTTLARYIAARLASISVRRACTGTWTNARPSAINQGMLRSMVALLLDLENLMHTSFVIEAYRTVERAHGQPPAACFAFGSHLHVAHTEKVARRLDIEVVTTSYGVKNAADKELVQVARTLWPNRSDTIVVGSGDRGYLKWLRNLRAEGLRLECVARDHQICKEAQARYDALYRMDAKRMNLPTPADLRQAVIDCIPQIQAGPVLMEDATGILRASRIVPRNTPGPVFFDRHANLFMTANGGRYVGHL